MELRFVPMDQPMGTRARSNAGPARPGRRRRTTALAAVAAFVVVLGASSPLPSEARGRQAEDETEDAATAAQLETLALAPDGPSSPDDPFQDVVDADVVVADTAAARLVAVAAHEEANAATLGATVDRDAAQVVEDEAQAERNAARTVLADERVRLSDLIVAAYVTGGEVDIEQYRDLFDGDTSDPAAGRMIMFSQVLERQQEVTEQAQADLRSRRKELKAARTELAAAQATLDDRLAVATTRADERTSAEQANDEAVVAAAQARTDLAAAASGPIQAVPLEVPIIGLPRLSAEDLASWFERSPYRSRVATPIADFAAWFIAEGEAEGIRGDVAFAQAVLETGGFTNNDSVSANNYSGIGHCDTCPTGWTFASPEMGVRAQIQLLKSYAVRTPAYANPLVDRRLRGPAGCCSTWGDLTTVWATDPGYGPKVMFLYTSMVQQALDRRAAGLG